MDAQHKKLFIAVIILLIAPALLLNGATAQDTAAVSGIVLNEAGEPIAGARVRRQTAPDFILSAEDGTFTLVGLPAGETVTITAWAESYWPGGVEATPPETNVSITLKRHPAKDDPSHEWYTSMPDPDDPIGCGHCMVAFPEWEHNAHGQAGVNPRFFSMYNGTDTTGALLAPPGYLNDFPDTPGNCANCHAPGAAANQPFSASMNSLEGVETEGVFCDFCHKVSGVYLDPATGLPYPNAPGVQSMQLNRPPADTHMFYGPFDDVTRRVAYLELEKQSEFCAPCHQFSFWGVPIYDSFREWQKSDYPAQGIECQTCHMAPTGVNYFVYPEQGGLIRSEQHIASHNQPGAADVELLQNTVEMTVSMERQDEHIEVLVSITNTDAGHHVPTDYPGRHMILVIEATGSKGESLVLQEGPMVPAWGGAEAGLPGKAFAKVLRDIETGEQPVVNYWKPVILASDNRIAAHETDRSRYVFAAPDDGGVQVTATLVFRRLFQSLAQAKGWETPDIVMEKTSANE